MGRLVIKYIDVTIPQGKLRGIVEWSWIDDAFIAFRGIPYVKPPIGELRFKVTSCEGSVFVGDMDDEALEQVNSDFESIIHPSILATLEEKSITPEDVRFRYFDNEPVSMKTITNYIDLIGDMHFYRGIFETVGIQEQQGYNCSTYLYKFSHEPKCSLPKKLLDVKFAGSTHGEELSYLFDVRLSDDLKCEMAPKLKDDPEKNMLIKRITQMWTDFAKSGQPTPNVTLLTPIWWPPIEAEDEFHYLIIDAKLEKRIMQKATFRFAGVM